MRFGFPPSPDETTSPWRLVAKGLILLLVLLLPGGSLLLIGAASWRTVRAAHEKRARALPASASSAPGAGGVAA